MNDEYRDYLGHCARLAWIEYCKKTGDTKPSHIAPWEELSEWDKEADRVIGEALAAVITAQIVQQLENLGWYQHGEGTIGQAALMDAVARIHRLM